MIVCNVRFLFFHLLQDLADEFNVIDLQDWQEAVEIAFLNSYFVLVGRVL